MNGNKNLTATKIRFLPQKRLCSPFFYLFIPEPLLRKGIAR
jgi:hypothetical protein